MTRENRIYTFGVLLGLSLEIYYSTFSKDIILTLIGFSIQLISIIYLIMTFIPNGVSMLDNIIKKTYLFFKNKIFKTNEEKEGFLPM